jgi:hypothetical protein
LITAAVFCIEKQPNIVYTYADVQISRGVHMKKLFIMNLGTTSFKFKLYHVQDADMSVKASGEIESVGAAESHWQYESENGTNLSGATAIPNHGAGFTLFLNILQHDGLLSNLSDLNAVGYKAVHGGNLSGTCIVDELIRFIAHVFYRVIKLLSASLFLQIDGDCFCLNMKLLCQDLFRGIQFLLVSCGQDDRPSIPGIALCQFKADPFTAACYEYCFHTAIVLQNRKNVPEIQHRNVIVQ